MFLYVKIADELKRLIESGYYRPGETLPPERELARTYNAGGKSVHNAIKRLERSRLIVRKHGSGNYVAPGLAVKPLGVIVALYGKFSLFRAGISEWFQELFRELPFQVQIFKFSDILTETELRNLARQYPGIPLLLINSCHASSRLAPGGMLSCLEDFPLFTRQLDRIPGNLKWLFPGPEGLPRYYSCPIFYSLNSCAFNGELARAAGLDADRPPRLWSEFLNWCETFRLWRDGANRRDLHPVYGCGSDFTGMTGNALLATLCGGNDYFTDSAEVRGGLVEYFTLIRELHCKGYLELADSNTPDPFVSGRYLFHLHAGSWLPRDIENFNPKLEIRFFDFPRPHEMTPRRSCAGSALLSLMENNCTPEARKRLLDCCERILTPPGSAALAAKLGLIPADSRSLDRFLAEHPAFEPFRNTLLISSEPWEVPAWDFNAELNRITRKLWRSPDTPPEEWAKEYLRFLEQRVK